MTAVFFTALGGCLLVPYIVLRSQKKGLLGLYFKVVVSACFILTAAALILKGEAHSRLQMGVLLGLFFGVLGDIFLDIKDMYPEHKDAHVFAGFLSFMTGHFCFLAGMEAAYGFELRGVLVAALAGLTLAAGVLLTEKPMQLRYGKFKAISLVYGFVLAFMTATAWVAYAVRGAGQAMLMGIGGALFLASDLVLSATFFGEGHDRPINYALNYTLYYGAQFVIAWSLRII